MNVSEQMETGRCGEYFSVFTLISQGFTAYLTDQGLVYDLVVDVGGSLLKGQVKTTLGASNYGKSKNVCRFGTRRAKKTLRSALIDECDFYAFVSIKDKEVAFMLTKDIESSKNKGKIKQTLDFSIDNTHSKMKKLSDFSDFSKMIKGI